MSTKQVSINPTKIRAYGAADADSVFCLVTNKEFMHNFRIEPSDNYRDNIVVPFDGERPFPEVMRERIPEGSHILTVMPNALLHSVEPEVLGRRKLLIMACRSGRTDLDGIEHFLRCGERTDPDEQEAFAERFFAKGEDAPFLELVDEDYGTSARFEHLSEIYEWHQQYGVLDWGQQQVFPSGEIACFLVPLYIKELKADVTFNINGSVALRGIPIVQSGPPSFLIEDQERIHARLSTMKDHAVIADLVNGNVVSLTASHPDCAPARDMLQAMFEVDSRFRRLYEVGFAFNREVTRWPGNSAMNEVCGGENGMIHLGLGMLPHTQYHLDIVCSGTRVLGKDQEVIFGRAADEKKRMIRRRAAMCPCIDV